MLPCIPDGYQSERWDGRCPQCGEFLEWALTGLCEDQPDMFEVEAGCAQCGGPYCEGHHLQGALVRHVWGTEIADYVEGLYQ
jgi:hypothetical protein